MNELQGIVDALAVTLDRPVGVDDRRFRALAYSSHGESVDPVRLASILQREAPREVIAWLESLGVERAEQFVRVPANADFGMAARVCMPVRFDASLLGYLWLIDEPRPLSQPEIEEARRATEELAVELFRERRLEHEDRERERALLRELTGHSAGRAADAGAALVDEGFLSPAAAHGVIVLQAVHADGCEAPDAVRVHLAAAAEQARRTVAPRHLLVLVAGEQVIALLAASGEQELERRARALSAVAGENLAASPGWSVVTTAGGVCASVRELPVAHGQAQLALRLARRLDGLGPVVHWHELGAYRALLRLVGDRDPAAVVPASVRRLLQSSDADVLVPTLECWLDHGGDARAAAEALFVHRSSLYARLHRIEEIAGADLHAGEDRLELHLGLRLWRMAGSPPPG